jgi:kumamolisin
VHDTHNNPNVISISWGSPEDADIWTEQAMTEVNETLKDAALAGITVCVAAGDDGSSDAWLDGPAHADFPASGPYVLAVGGTSIHSKTTPLPDVVWFEGDGLRQPDNPNSGSTGGGVSAVFPRPDWQSGITILSVNPGAMAGRCIPDLAVNADWTVSPYLLFVDGAPQPNGGTSAATPLVAGLIALINEQIGANVGYLTPLLYQPAATSQQPLGASVCTDVVSGGNTTAEAGGYEATQGYDAVSGWGTPDGMKLMAALTATPGTTKGTTRAGAKSGVPG